MSVVFLVLSALTALSTFFAVATPRRPVGLGFIGEVLKVRIGNGPQVLKDIDAVANDFAMAEGGGTCGKMGQLVPVGMGQPTLRITGVTVGGTAA